MEPPPYTTSRDVPEGDRLIIALDFGTTFSGIAYAFSTDPEKVYTITNWPGGEDQIVPKAPTVIKYDSGSKTSFQWGYELEMSLEDKITGLKLLLDPDQPRPYFIPTNIQAEIAKLPKPVLEVASDYMRAVFEHALKEIESESLDPSFLENYQKQFVLTVPAVWSDKAKDMTLRAARNAGINPVSMITEPEAASLFTLLSVKNKGLRNGDAIVICDAGGGTVDLVAYEIQSLNPFELKALTAPSGGICGSLMLNNLFEEEIRKTVGDDAFLKLKKTDGYRSGVKDFDRAIKLAFRGKNDPDKFISFPMANLKDNKALGLVSNSMTLSGTTMFRIFDPIIREIDKLVSEQVTKVRMERLQLGNSSRAAIKAIFLVGGFGSSAYLKDVIEKSNPGVLVIQPKEAWSAIVRGAVMSKLGLAPVITATKAPKHYGTSCNSTWQSSRDRGYPNVRDIWEEEDKCEIMEWFIYKDDDLVRDKKITLPFYRKWAGSNPTGATLEVEDQLFECSTLLAPDHPEDGKLFRKFFQSA
ncbi:hypothetical protein B0J14DRAFT_707549 [Halenospora varia]|nr:hypothetical protein B0J14DRAFT_707549 [Halenospora varia]